MPTLLAPGDLDPDPIVDDLTRRRFLIGTVSLAAFLAACGDDDDDSGAARPRPGRSPAPGAR